MSQDRIAEELLNKINQAENEYYKLVLLVGIPGSGKTSVLKKINGSAGYPLIDFSLEISRRMLDLNLTYKQRSLQTPELARKTVSDIKSRVVLLDNIEILFDISLKWDALGVLQKLSKNIIIVATWPGTLDNNRLCYAEPDHPEFKRYELRDFLCLKLADAEQTNL